MLTRNGTFGRSCTAGFTLIEVLVTMLTLAIGLTGNYLLFVRSLQQQQHGVFQGRVVLLARAAAADLQAGRVPALADPAACNHGDAAACAALAWQTVVTTRWQDVVARSVPGGSIALSRAVNGTTTITLQWRDVLSPRAHTYQLTITPS